MHYSLTQLFARGFSLTDIDFMRRKNLATLANRNGNTMLKVPNLEYYYDDEDMSRVADKFFGEAGY
jgi:hypothetical protein